MTYNIKQGEDLILEIPVFKDNQKVDISGADVIRVALIVKGLTVYKYMDDTREVAISGYGQVYVSATDNTVLELYLTREQSKDFPIGELNASIAAEYPDTLLNGIAEEYEAELGEIAKGYLKDETLS